MNEPIISPVFIYFLQLVDPIKDVFGGLSLVGIGVGFVIYLVSLSCSSSEKAEIKNYENLINKDEKNKDNVTMTDFYEDRIRDYKNYICKSEQQIILYNMSRVISKWMIIICFCLGFLSIFLPSRNTLIAMYTADHVTPANIKTVTSTAKQEAKVLIDYIFEKIDNEKQE